VDFFRYYVSLRAGLLKIITGTENSRWGGGWDNTIPNSITKNRLEKLAYKFIGDAKEFGFYLVNRHCACPNSKHEGYLTSNRYGETIVYENGYSHTKYIYLQDSIYSGDRLGVCPCDPENRPVLHYVVGDVLFDENANIQKCQELVRIISDIYEAIDSAEDGRPRAAIRENLLRAVLRINDELMPQSIDDYIAEKLLAE
jgi:hypothetical protein